MSSNSPNHPAAPADDVLRERSLNLPTSIARRSNTTTPSTLTNSGNTSRHVQFDYDAIGRTDRTSLLALACMPPSDDEDNAPIGHSLRRSHFEEEQDYDLNQLLDYEGDSDDEAPDADALVCDTDNTVNDREGERAISSRDDGFTACDDMLTAEELHQQQSQPNAPLLIPGAPPGWKKPSVPDDWKPNKKHVNLGEPDLPFEDIDNPGEWSEYSYQPKFLFKDKKRDKHVCHAMPSGATAVPVGRDGKRAVDGFEFFYNGWTREATDRVCRSNANRDNLFPECRKGSLDADVLKSLGVSKERMHHTNDDGPDASFWCQLLLPIHDTRNGGTVKGDPRKPCCPHVGISSCAAVEEVTRLKRHPLWNSCIGMAFLFMMVF